MPIEFTRVKNDVNGNPRYVCHFLRFIKSGETFENVPVWDISAKYAIALSRSRQFGGRKFHNKQYGGGIVFQSYEIDRLGRDIEAFVASL